MATRQSAGSRLPAIRHILRLAVGAGLVAPLPALAAGELEEVIVVGTSPGAGLGQDADTVPFAVQLVSDLDLDQAQSLDLTDYLNVRAASVNINSAQNNPLQPDLQFRGFTASPLLGLPQGIAVYQNGVRINEPLGDAVNWDLLPESAISEMQLISGADPVFGLNTLGGALVVRMKDGFNFTGTQGEISGGSWDRWTGTLESGGNNGSWGYYANLSYFEEDGWRDLSDSDARNFYGSLSWRNGDTSSANLVAQIGRTELRGNGAAPVGLLAEDREEIFTAPDITENDLLMFAIDGAHFVTPNLQLAGSAFWRRNDTESFNGDASEFELCEYAGGNRSLFEEAEDVEAALEADLGLELDDVCEGGDPSIRSFADLEARIEAAALAAGRDPEDYELEDAADEITGSGVLSDEAINNISSRDQDSRGFDGKLILLGDLFGKANRLTAGLAYYDGEVDFDAVVELAEMDPVTRSTAGLGLGSFYAEGETRVTTDLESWSLYFLDTIEWTERLSLTLAGRYNEVDIRLRDRSGEQPELDGDHTFRRFNPSVGLTYDLGGVGNVYASYSESNRVPTPIELACNEGVFELARRFALEEGEDPDDIDFECRLPNAFLADPPLDDVVTKSIELGIRGGLNGVRYRLGLFHADNHDDILFQTTGRATGLFANVDRTRRFGVEALVDGQTGSLHWYGAYTWLEATFEDDFAVLSPNHPNADADGTIQVERGDHLPGIPEHMLKLGVDYYFGDNFRLGAEAVYNGSIYLRGDESNEIGKIDDYVLVNLLASYALQERLTLFLRVTNLFDEEYENFGLLGEDPTEVLEGLADERPIFLGTGSPRAAWLGARYRF
ncbi:MAG TPA: TonB-dependent receptor [Pseudomonadales bacterium]